MQKVTSVLVSKKIILLNIKGYIQTVQVLLNW